MSTPYESQFPQTPDEAWADALQGLNPEYAVAEAAGGLSVAETAEYPDETFDDEDSAEQTPDDEIPSLLPLLEHITSPNRHRFDDSMTVYTKSREARQLEPSMRTPDQSRLLIDLGVMKRFAPHSSLYEDVYTPDEIHGLAMQLIDFNNKKQADYSVVEGKVIDVILGEINRGQVVASSIRGIATRAEKNEGKRRSMQPDKLAELAHYASTVIRNRTQEAFSEYYIAVRDPNPREGGDLTAVYQFVADAYALDVKGARNVAIQEQCRDAYVANCERVNQWFAEVEPMLADLPRDLKIERHGAHWFIKNLVGSMNTRLTSADRIGKNKGYQNDPIGAIRLQMLIGHKVEDLKKLIAERVDEADTEIIPLD
ncbi:MAG: hypothetical protein ACQR33_04710 [Candidatus Saccharibacteria bacterium]